MEIFVFINGIGKLDFFCIFLNLSLLSFFKHLSISSNVVLRQVFYCYIVYCDRFLQLFHELNLQLDCSIAAIQKTILVILTLCAIVCEFLFLIFLLSTVTVIIIYFHCFVVCINSPTVLVNRL